MRHLLPHTPSRLPRPTRAPSAIDFVRPVENGRAPHAPSGAGAETLGPRYPTPVARTIPLSRPVDPLSSRMSAPPRHSPRHATPRTRNALTSAGFDLPSTTRTRFATPHLTLLPREPPARAP